MIDPEGLQHFCIYGYNIFNLLIENYKPFIQLSSNTSINWKHIYSLEFDNKFIFIQNNNTGWNYLIWNNFDISETINFIEEISKALDANINYYFVDGQIDAIRLVFSEKGKIVKGICYQMGEIQYNLNYSRSEIDSIIFQSYDRFWDIYEKTTQPIYEAKKDEIQIYYGQF